MKLCDLLASLPTNTRLVVFSAKRVNGKWGYTVLKPVFEGRARDCYLDIQFVDNVFARGYNTIECYAYDDKTSVF